MSSGPSPAPSPDWIVLHAVAYARAVELAHQRYGQLNIGASLISGPMTDLQRLDGYVEYINWITALRRLCSVIEAAKKLHDPTRASAIAAAVAAFENAVKCDDVIHVRDVLEHADDYGAGLGRKKVRFPDVDMDGWTLAAQKLRNDLRQALKR